MSIRNERINNVMHREISYILANEIKDKHINFVTVTACEVTSDLSFARVYFTVLENKEETLKSLKKAKGFIRKTLADRIELRHIPDLQFIYDESIEYGKRIEDKIKEIHED